MPVADMPRLGLGTFSSSNREQWRGCVESALEMGYRHVDTAQNYGNESYVGRGIADSDVAREELFLATKTIHPPDVPSADPTREDVIAAVEGCLDRLGTEYVDLLYVHWPANNYDPEVALPAFDDPTIREVAEKHDATPAQVSLAWLLSKENVAARDLVLDPADVAAIDAIEREHRIIDREYAPWRG